MRHDSHILLQALKGETTERAPIWLMRQAGRTDPAYLKLREEAGMPLERLFLSPEWAARITLLPARLGVDGLVLFQDILTPLIPLGISFRFDPGPVAHDLNPEFLMRLAQNPFVPDFADDLPHLEALIRLVRQHAPDLPIIGFAGAPFTLLAFIVAEGSPWSENGKKALHELLATSPDLARSLLTLLTDVSAAWLEWQIACGADTVQLFESAASLVSPEQYRSWVLPYQQQVLEQLCHKKVPRILFAHFSDRVPDAAELLTAGADVYSLPSCLSIREFRYRAGCSVPVQGNLDNILLARGAWNAVEEAILRCLEEGNFTGHTFNLGHGLLKETPPDRVVQLIRFVRNITPNRLGNKQ
ncbi:MAG TPA: uroporphyrinogen decarboxylase family protein [Candidatus Hydrogenedentes bacterium]|nr:uroporphyrinogen decarboxylase family protein [Candidatus Hydrogenedentota bacterium]